MKAREATEIIQRFLAADGPDPRQREAFKQALFALEFLHRAEMAAVQSIRKDRVHTERLKEERRAAVDPIYHAAGQRWAEEEQHRLVAGFKAGESIEQLAAHHARNPGGIVSRLLMLGLIDLRSVRPTGPEVVPPPQPIESDV